MAVNVGRITRSDVVSEVTGGRIQDMLAARSVGQEAQNVNYSNEMSKVQALINSRNNNSEHSI